MFTGLIEKVGCLVDLRREGGGFVIRVDHTPWDDPLVHGESVAVSGACLSVARWRDTWFECDVLDETLARTSLGKKAKGSQLNLERARKAGGRYGGHMVQGHVDGVGRLFSRRQTGRDWVLRVGCSSDLTREMVQKGSVALDGVSLTLTAVESGWFEVNLIPLTLADTALGSLVENSPVNIETDIIGKYVRCFLQNQDRADGGRGVDLDLLSRSGIGG